MIVIATKVVRDEGTIVMLEGRAEPDAARSTGLGYDKVTFACEPRMAQAIVDAIEAGEEPRCDVPSWAIWAS